MSKMARQMLQESLKRYEMYKSEGFFNPMKFYQAFYLASAMCSNEELRQQFLSRHQERVSLLKQYYFLSLFNAISENRIKTGETHDLYSIRVKNLYLISRADVFNELCRIIEQDYALIFQVLKASEDEHVQIRYATKNFHDTVTFGILKDNYYG